MLAAVTSFATAAILFRYPPAESRFYPSCPFHQMTGLLCPGCGATRALAALLHGHVQDAIHWNALFVVIMLPTLGLYLISSLQSRRWLSVKPPAIVVLAAVTAIFTLLRNFPIGVL